MALAWLFAAALTSAQLAPVRHSNRLGRGDGGRPDARAERAAQAGAGASPPSRETCLLKCGRVRFDCPLLELDPQDLSQKLVGARTFSHHHSRLVHGRRLLQSSALRVFAGSRLFGPFRPGVECTPSKSWIGGRAFHSS
eukprot:4215982-Pleurochrysis_carterae.AAC.1